MSPRLAPVLGAVFSLAATHAAAQAAYPAKTVQVVVPYTAGGAADILVRAVTTRLSETWGRSIVIDIRAGASGMIGSEIVAKAEPDGHVLLGQTSGYPATAALRRKLPFDPARAIVAVAMIAKAPMVLVVHPSLPVKSVKEFIALAKQQPGKLNYASAGVGGNNHYATSLLSSATGIKLTHVPFKGVSQATTALLSGEIEMLIASSPAITPQIKAGRVRALGVTSLERSALLPDLAPIAQLGVPGYSYELWWGLLGPAGIPADRLNFINASVNKLIATPDFRKFLLSEGVEPWPLTTAQLADFIPKEIERYRKIAKSAGMEPE